MKRVLISGANSYIGTSFARYLEQWPNKYEVSTLDMKDDAWRKVDLSPFDVVFHVAGIAHMKAREKDLALFFQVNRDLTFETARKAEEAGVNNSFI
ncbi:MAG: NAD-dependent epimerase/dehydratase family protein [Clostridiaceae bacterium]|nr:NAD-dependent epimerase/dehydratase family protein [Clostridiaceae bacterium]